MFNSIITNPIIQSTTRVIGGVIAARTGTWLSRQVMQATGGHLGTLLDKMISLRIQRPLFECTNFIQIPTTYILQ